MTCGYCKLRPFERFVYKCISYGLFALGAVAGHYVESLFSFLSGFVLISSIGIYLEWRRVNREMAELA